MDWISGFAVRYLYHQGPWPTEFTDGEHKLPGLQKLQKGGPRLTSQKLTGRG